MKNTLIPAAVAAIVAVLVVLLVPAKTPVVGFGASTDGSQAVLSNPTNYDYLVARLALGLGNATSNSNTGAGNVNIAAVRQNIASATSTTCTLKNPFSATSTILSFNYNITVGTSTPAAGIDYIVGSTTSQFSTSTNMVSDAYVPAGGQKTITWNPSGNNAVISANNYITVGALASSSIPTGGIITTGTCAATFQSL